MAFGSIEAMTYELLRHTLRYNVAQVLIDANAPLGQRLDLLIAIAQERDGHEWVELGEVLTRIKALARKRNLIAHNGVTFEMFIGKNGEFDFDEVIRNRKLRGSLIERSPPGHRMAFEELKKHRGEADTLDQELRHAAGEVLELLGGI